MRWVKIMRVNGTIYQGPLSKCSPAIVFEKKGCKVRVWCVPHPENRIVCASSKMTCKMNGAPSSLFVMLWPNPPSPPHIYIGGIQVWCGNVITSASNRRTRKSHAVRDSYECIPGRWSRIVCGDRLVMGWNDYLPTLVSRLTLSAQPPSGRPSLLCFFSGRLSNEVFSSPHMVLLKNRTHLFRVYC